MDRREFIRKCLLATALSVIRPNLLIEDLLEQTVKSDDEEFVTFITIFFNLHVNYPRKCAYIEGIVEPKLS